MNTLFSLGKRWFETRSTKQKWTAVLTVIGLLCTVVLFSLNGSAETSRDPLGSTPLYFAGALIKLLVVLLLIVLSAIFARRWLQAGLQRRTVRQMQLVESVRLSPKQVLHLVSVGDQQFLIGATDQTVSLISQVEINVDESRSEAVHAQPTLDFGSLLSSLNTNLPGSPSK